MSEVEMTQKKDGWIEKVVLQKLTFRNDTPGQGVRQSRLIL